MRILSIWFLVLLPAAAPNEDRVCTCDAARLANGWCKACKVGYVASARVPSYMLFDALDAHGHEIDPERIECAKCKMALPVDGFCDRSGMGFVDQKAYFSKLTYALAKGRVRKAPASSCKTCEAAADRPAWCESCQLGTVGNVEFGKKDDFEQAALEYKRLLEAIATLERCEMCAVAMFMRSRCPKCKISFEKE